LLWTMVMRKLRISKGWIAVYVITGLVIIVVGAVQSNVAAIVIGAVFIPFGVGLDAVLGLHRQRNKRAPVRRV
jgi:hypothetical protein